MHARHDPDDGLVRLARLQGGVVSSEQVSGSGLGRSSRNRLVESGRWQRLGRGLYLTGDGEPSWLGFAWGGILLGGPEARLAGLAAAHLHGLTGPPTPVEVLVPHERQLRDRVPWSFRRERAGVRGSRSPGSPPRTTVEDTVLDLAEVSDEDAAVSWVTRAVQERRTTVPRLRAALHERQKVRHRRLLADLLTDVAVGAETPLELRYLRDVERAHGLPRGTRQVRSRSGPYLRDVVYEEYATVVELDGRLGHEGAGRFRDFRRDNAAVLVGELPLRYGWPDVNGSPCAVAVQVGAVLAGSGWPGLLTRCPRCWSASESDFWVS